MTDPNNITAHYTSGALLQRIEAALATIGAKPPLSTDLLAPLDEFHIGGRQATVPFLDKLGLAPGDRVLDMGCGIGGPARFAARSRGARVTGIDLTAEFVEAGSALNLLTGLGGQVDLVEGSILDLPFGAGRFDAAYMIHVGMNIADKHRLASEAARVLKPGAPFGIYDVMQVAPGDIDYPVPWADGPRASALAPPETYREALTAAGFDILSQTDRSGFAKAFFERLATAQADAKGPPPLGLHLVMGAKTARMVANMKANISAGRIAPIEMIARKPARKQG